MTEKDGKVSLKQKADKLMLHIIDNFPIQLSFLQQMHSGDTIILKDNAVYAAKLENIKTSLSRRTICFKSADAIFMTEKDAVKCRSFATPQHWYVPVQASVESRFIEKLIALLTSK
jgi:tetraacyldisaccharide-1-P 4'-kinase